MLGIEDFAKGSTTEVLRSLYVIMCDTTSSNTGTLVVTGAGGSASHLRVRIEQLTRGPTGEQGHLLVEQRDCLSHAGHNECEAGMTAMGICAEDRTFLSTKKDIDEAKVEEGKSKRRVWAKNLLDELTEYVGSRPACIRFIESEEQLGKKSLGKPVTGTKERWGFYGTSAKWYKFTEQRVELIARYAADMEKRRVVEELEGIAETELKPSQKIERLKKAGLRAMLHELNNPQKRIQLIIFAWYFEETLDPFLGYTQSSRMFQITRAHRVIRRRLRLMAELKGSSLDGGKTWQPDPADGVWKTKLEPIIASFVSKHHSWVFDEVNPRSLTRTFFEATHDDFHMRTRGFWSPLCLIFGVLDEKGEAVLTAKELVKLAGANPMVKLPQLIAFDPDNPSRKGSLHEGITTRDVVKAITDTSYHGPALAFLPDMWKHIVALSKMPLDTVLRDVPELAPLFTLLHPMAENQPISNGGEHGAESLMKKIGKVCKPQQRLNDKTVSQNVGAVCRDPDKLYHLTAALDLEASYALGHNKASRVKEKLAVPIVAASDAGLGFTAEGDEGCEEWASMAAGTRRRM